MDVWEKLVKVSPLSPDHDGYTHLWAIPESNGPVTIGDSLEIEVDFMPLDVYVDTGEVEVLVESPEFIIEIEEPEFVIEVYDG